MRPSNRLNVLLGSLALLVWGCTPATSQSPSVQRSASPSEAAVGNLPPGCEPIELRDPNGERIELDGTWTEVGSPDRGELMTWWIVTQGDCVWGAGQTEDVATDDPFGGPDQVQSLSGRIGSDFVVTGGILWLGPFAPGSPGSVPRYASLRMLIEFDDAGSIVLREDREPGVRSPHCPDPVASCPAPLVLQRTE